MIEKPDHKSAREFAELVSNDQAFPLGVQNLGAVLLDITSQLEAVVAAGEEKCTCMGSAFNPCEFCEVIDARFIGEGK